MEYPLTPPGVEPVTFRFVAQHVNNCVTAVPHTVGIACLLNEQRDKRVE